MKTLAQIWRFISPINFFCFIQLYKQRKCYYYTLSKVTRMESVWDLRSKIDDLSDKMRKIYFD